MTAYVDKIFTVGKAGFSNTSAMKHGNKWCHLIADTIEELHEMAESIGLKKTYFQDKTIPHYDLVPSKRALAIRNGATEVETREFIEIGKRCKKSCQHNQVG